MSWICFLAPGISLQAPDQHKSSAVRIRLAAICKRGGWWWQGGGATKRLCFERNVVLLSSQSFEALQVLLVYMEVPTE